MAGRMLWMVLMNCFMKRGVDGDAVCCCCGSCSNEEDNSEEEEEDGSNVSTTVDFLFDAVSFTTTLHALFLWIIEQEREREGRDYREDEDVCVGGMTELIKSTVCVELMLISLTMDY